MVQHDDSGITARLADFSLRLRYEDLPAPVRAAAKNAILDVLGAALIGAGQAATRSMLAAVTYQSHVRGEATVWGTSSQISPAAAALVNSYAAHALDFDDSQHDSGDHMSAAVLPSALALAETLHRSGKEVLTAYVAGFEVGCKLGRAGGFSNHIHELGFHPTGVLCHFGAAAAAGKLLGLAQLEMKRTFGIVAGQAAGLISAYGTMCKSLNAANAAHHAVLAALLAKQGFTGPENIFDGERSVFSVYGAQVKPEMLGELGAPFEIMHNTIKAYACVGWRNPVLEGVMALANAHDLRTADVTKMKIGICTKVKDLPNYAQPRTGLESKFSTEHAAAVALIDRAGGIQQFTDERVGDPVLAALRSKIDVEIDEALGTYQVRIAMYTTDGRELTQFIPAQKGSPDNPLSWDELVTKFRANAEKCLPRQNVEKLIAMVREFETIKDTAELTRLCCKE